MSMTGTATTRFLRSYGTYICKSTDFIEHNTFLAGYYLTGFLSTRPDGGYTLVQYMSLWATYTV